MREKIETFQFPSNGKVCCEFLQFQSWIGVRFFVSIPFKREGMLREYFQMDSAHPGTNVSIPFKREGMLRGASGILNLDQNLVFQFPSNGKVCCEQSKNSRFYDFNRLFQFPSNGKVCCELDRQRLQRRRGDGFNSLQTGRYVART